MGRHLIYPHVQDALAYANAVQRGEILASKWVRLAVERQLRDLEKYSRRDSKYVFDAQKANRICAFIENLPHVEGEYANRREDIVLQPWQKFILTTVFGWTHRSTGLRRYTKAYIEVPRKNGKSTITAGVGLYLLTADDEEGAQVYSAAVTGRQAKIVFNIARRMAKKESEFREFYGVDVKTHNLNVETTNSKFEPIASDSDSQEGLNVSGGLIDELHAHKTRAMYDVIETAMGARSQPLLWNITTAGSNQAGICYEVHVYVTKILQESVEDESFFGIIYCADEQDDWRLESTWRKANPNYGVSIYPKDMEGLAKKASEMASAQNTFLTKRLCLWVNADSAWMNMRDWRANADTSLSLEAFEGEDCYIGLDLSSKIDITSKVRLFKRDDKYYVFASHYLPENNLEDENRDKNAHYSGWAKQGWLTLTPGDMVDLNIVEDEIRDDLRSLDVVEIGYDPWQASQMVGTLLDEKAPMVEVKASTQNYSEPMKEIEALTKAGRLIHQDDPILNWMISNVVCHVDARDNIYPRKQQRQNKIDGVIALIIALNRAIAEKPKKTSVYETRGVLRI